ncbi:hypothetical protein Dimus_020482 [Dionaea muscipula]
MDVFFHERRPYYPSLQGETIDEVGGSNDVDVGGSGNEVKDDKVNDNDMGMDSMHMSMGSMHMSMGGMHEMKGGGTGECNDMGMDDNGEADENMGNVDNEENHVDAVHEAAETSPVPSASGWTEMGSSFQNDTQVIQNTALIPHNVFESRYPKRTNKGRCRAGQAKEVGQANEAEQAKEAGLAMVFGQARRLFRPGRYCRAGRCRASSG